MDASTRIRNQLLAAWKYALSFVKRDWQWNDYPIWIREQNPEEDDLHIPGLTLRRYVAMVVNWSTVSGSGDSKVEAMGKLKDCFEKVKLAKPLPRPGTGLPIEFASQDRIMALTDLADDFLKRVLEVEGAWISDESTLWDFSLTETDEEFHARIKEIYGVDVSDIKSGNIAEILERIAAERAVQ
jgi:hypothetical protein